MGRKLLLSFCGVLTLAGFLLVEKPAVSNGAEPATVAPQVGVDVVTTVRRPGVLLHARASGGGEGVPVLFVHGLAGDMEVWSSAMSHQGRVRRAAAFDLRGHGSSSLPKNGSFLIPAMSEDAAAVAEALGFKRYVLVGHSLGAAVVASCAGRHPDRVAGVMFLEPPNRSGDRSQARKERLLGTGMGPAYRAQMKVWWGDALQPFPSSRDRVLAALEHTPPRSIGGCLAGLAIYDPVPDLERSHAILDSLTVPGPDNPRAYHVLVPAITHEVIDRTSHWVMLDAPEEFDRRLDAFLERVDRQERTSAK